MYRSRFCSPFLSRGSASLPTPLVGFFLVFLFAPLAVAAPMNVILFIGDGMGPQHVDAGRYFANGGITPLSFENMAYSGTMTHNNYSGGVTDSAAAATAMATGRKVNNSVISQALPGDGSDLKTALEIFQDQGKRTGLVTMETPITDATPASFGAHVATRGDAAGIANDYFTQTKPYVLFGEPGGAVNPTLATNNGYAVVTNNTELTGLNTTTTGHVSGQFNFGASDAPTLAQMTTTALDILSQDTDGFFLMVEHEGTDTGAHGNSISAVTKSVIELDSAVNAALGWITTNSSLSNTLVIVTADHETGGLTATNNGSGNQPGASWTTSGHTTTPVPIYASGPAVDAMRVQGTIDNTNLFHILTSTAIPSAYGAVTPNISTGFEQASVGATSFSRDPGDTEIEWNLRVSSGSGFAKVDDTLDGTTLTGQQFVVHTQTIELESENIDVRDYKQVQVSIDARAYQTSSGFENADDIDLSVLVSEDGVNFTEVFFFQSEGDRSGGKGEIKTAFGAGYLDADGGFITITAPVGRISDNINSIRVVIDADNDSPSEWFVFDNVVVSGLLKTGREEVIAANSFEGVSGELGYTRSIDRNGDGTFGDEDTSGEYGVISTFSGVTSASDGSKAYRASGATGANPVNQLKFDAVDLTGHEDVAVTLDLFVSTTDWEADDFVKIVVLADTGTTIDELVILDTTTMLGSAGGDIDTIGLLAEGEFIKTWEAFGIAIDDQYVSAVLQITSSSNSSVLSETFYFDNIEFNGSEIVPEPNGLVLMVCLLVGLLVGGGRRRQSQALVKA